MGNRIISRMIACTDSALVALKGVGLILFLIRLNAQNVTSVSRGAVWGVLALALIILFMEAFAAFSLIRATPVEFDGLRRLRWIRFWSGITIFLVILQVLVLTGLLIGGGNINAGAAAVPVVLVIYRSLAIYLVQRYVNEIQSTVF